MHLSPAQSRRALTFASLLFLPPTLIIGIWLAQYGGFQLNDLFAPCIKLYPQMSKYRDMFLSGSGSSVFFLK